MPCDRHHVNRQIAVHGDPRGILSPTRKALEQLGYTLVTAGHGAHDHSSRASIRIVDEFELPNVPSAHVEPRTPIVLLTGARPPTPVNRDCDPRIIGRVNKPATLTPLYGLLQAGLEECPRRVPRVVTRLSARITLPRHSATGSVVSLSEQGCLMRLSEKPLRVGTPVGLEFSLPATGALQLTAHCIHGSGSEVGLRFEQAPCEARQAIGSFVTDVLVAG